MCFEIFEINFHFTGLIPQQMIICKQKIKDFYIVIREIKLPVHIYNW